jgi:hypothetical protein
VSDILRPPWAGPWISSSPIPEVPERAPLHLQAWVRLPNSWIEERGLTRFAWARGSGADNIAALMALMVIAHFANQETGAARLTWADICDYASLSRAKLSKGLDILAEQGLVHRRLDGRSQIQLANYNPERDWAKLPARGLYTKQRTIRAFKDFTLRSRAEMNALKIYLLMASRRDRKANAANLSYDKITLYAGIHHTHIRTAVSLLAAQNLIHVSSQPSALNEYGVSNQYRLAHLDTTRHEGTIGRHSL